MSKCLRISSVQCQKSQHIKITSTIKLILYYFSSFLTSPEHLPCLIVIKVFTVIYNRPIIGKQSSDWESMYPGYMRFLGSVWAEILIMESFFRSLVCIDTLSFSLKWYSPPPIHNHNSHLFVSSPSLTKRVMSHTCSS